MGNIIVKKRKCQGKGWTKDRQIEQNVLRVFSIIFCEVVAIYGLIMAIVFTAKLQEVKGADITSSEMYYKGKDFF